MVLMASKFSADILRELRQKLRFTQAQFADELGVKRAAYKNWEYGLSNFPAELEPKLQAMINHHEAGIPLVPIIAPAVPIPFLGVVAADNQANWTDPFDSDDEIYVPNEMAERGRFACTVQTDSMYDFIHPGDILVFHRSDIPRIGAVTMWRDDRGMIAIKTLKHNGSEYLLEPFNKTYDSCPARGMPVGYLVGRVREQGSRRSTDYDPGGLRPN